MNASRFWKIIDASRKRVSEKERDGNFDRQVEDLRAELSKLDADEVSEFHQTYYEQFDRALDHSLRGAAFLLAGGCSDDGFDYFRNWLISLGRKRFEMALKDPDTLADLDGKVEDVFFEEFASVSARVYQELTGRRVPSPKRDRQEPRGKPWNEGDLQKRFPRISAALEKRG